MASRYLGRPTDTGAQFPFSSSQHLHDVRLRFHRRGPRDGNGTAHGNLFVQYTERKSCRVNRGRCFLRRKEGSGLGQSCTEPGGFGEEDVWGGRRLHCSDAKFKSGLCAPLQQSSTLSHAAPLAPPLPPTTATPPSLSLPSLPLDILCGARGEHTHTQEHGQTRAHVPT